MTTFAHKVAVVTGAGSGIGRALALELASRGARLSLSDIDANGLAATTDLVAARGGSMHTAIVDVSDRESVNAYAASVVEHYGEVHIVINNAGIAGDVGTFVDADLETFGKVLGVNLWGVIHGTKAFLPHLIASGDGHLVNMSSVSGIVAQPMSSAYCTSKFAVRGFTESVAVDLLLAGHPVKVTVIHPAGVATSLASAALERARSGGLAVTADLEKRVATYNEKLLTMPPEKAARIILDGVAANKKRVLVGKSAKFLDLAARLLPRAIPAAAVWSDKDMFPDDRK
ncbi:SDR family NAD(P)-dependent oxidoreductase [Smaragdicoccus niigatensis]|uniref:SDR family NAD(P)-dependent oxidoreductase n=1 Tax=Smaragdicoccus niigatensis TaxID=359359 RepID=UPI00058B2B7C|nr:SDR family NAD(P)-dependent oxidoreductase [Smaragdicoccus niigatensis]